MRAPDTGGDSDESIESAAESLPLHGRRRRRVLGLIGSGSVALLAGCTGSDGGGTATDEQSSVSGETTGSQDTTQAGDINAGGHLRMAHSSGPTNIHPMRGASAVGFIVNDFGYSRLTAVDRELNPQPALATDWESNSDSTEWTFQLQEDATFANLGDVVTADDVKATFELMMSSERAQGAQKDAEGIASVDVVDEKTVTFNLEAPRVDFPLFLTESGTYSQILPKKLIEGDYDAMEKDTYGTGPFKIEDFETGSHYTFVARDDYFGTDEEGNQLPYIDKLTLKVMPEAVTRINSLQDQRADCVHNLTQQMEGRVKNSEGMYMNEIQGGEFYPIALNTTVEPLGNPDVRRAIKCAIDRNAITESITSIGSMGNHSLINPLHRYYTKVDNEFGPGAKPDLAREYLEKAGYGDGFELPTLYYVDAYMPAHEIIATLAQQGLKEVGVEFDIARVTHSKWISEQWNAKGVWYVSKWAMRVLPGTNPKIALHSEASWNATKYDNPEFDKAIDNALGATNSEEKAKHFAKAQRIMHNHATYYVPGFLVNRNAANEYVQNYTPHPVDNRGIENWAWLTDDAPTT